MKPDDCHIRRPRQVEKSGERWADAPRETYRPKETLYSIALLPGHGELLLVDLTRWLTRRCDINIPRRPGGILSVSTAGNSTQHQPSANDTTACHLV